LVTVLDWAGGAGERRSGGAKGRAGAARPGAWDIMQPYMDATRSTDGNASNLGAASVATIQQGQHGLWSQYRRRQDKAISNFRVTFTPNEFFLLESLDKVDCGAC